MGAVQQIGRYEIEREIGRGAMDPMLRGRVAVKTLPLEGVRRRAETGWPSVHATRRRLEQCTEAAARIQPGKLLARSAQQPIRCPLRGGVGGSRIVPLSLLEKRKDADGPLAWFRR